MNCETVEIKKSNSISAKNLINSNKQLFFDLDKNKYYLKYDDNRKLYESNVLALKKPQINIPQTGFAKYNDRINSNSIEKLNFKMDDSLYHPQSLRFEGYSQFPRPIIIPFSNISKLKLQKHLKDLQNTENFFTTNKNKNIFNKKTNEGLYFYSGTINNIVNTKNKKIVLNKINDALSFDENENIFNGKEKIRNYEKNALKKLKNKILSNSTNTIFGRKLKRPDAKFIHQFKINYNIYFKNPIKKNKLKNSEAETDKKNYFEDLYNALNKKRVQKVLKSSKKKLFLEIDDNINNEKNKKSIDKQNIKIYNEQKVLSHPSQNKEEEKNKEGKVINNINEEAKKKDNVSNIKNYFDSLYLNKNKFKTLEYESKAKYMELLSEENEYNNNYNYSLNNKTRNYGNNKILSIKTLSDLNKNLYLEKKQLIGFIKPEIVERSYRRAVPKYKSTLNIYKKEWELYKTVNPIRYKLDEEKKMKEFKFLQEKLMKGKKLVSLNAPKAKKNKFFATSNILSSQSSQENI